MDTLCNIELTPMSAPELILDLLVACGDTLSAQALCLAGELLDVKASAVRVALNRLSQQGKIINHPRGFYRLNPSGPVLAQVVDDWAHKETQTLPWQGGWLAVHDGGVQRSDKTTWRHNALALSLQGFRLLQPGLHVRPDNLLGGASAMRTHLQALGLAPQALVFRLDELDKASHKQAMALWDVKALAVDYRAMQKALVRSTRTLEDGPLEKAIRESLLLGRAVIIRLVRDPLLPEEMTSSRARLELTADMKRYQCRAQVLWRKWLSLSIR